MKKKIIIFIIVIIITISLSVFGYYYYNTTYLDSINDINLELLGEKEITLKLNDEYNEAGSIAHFREEDITHLINTEGSVDTSKVGDYIIKYNVNYKNKDKTIERSIKIIDDVIPEIKLKGKTEVSLYVNDKYSESGATASDNYDGDITDNIVITGEVDTSKEGKYELTYTIKDSSNNENSVKRVVVVKKRQPKPGVAVLNYHFFYDNGASCPGVNCMSTEKFEEQLKYLKDNGYKALTMEEFRAWMYNEIEIPKKSVLITIDDGALGTGFHNGNKLIPLLEKYQTHATLFLITGWWKIENYKSDYLDIESHTYDMHTEGYCQGVARGAKMLCLEHDEVLKDLRLSIEITGSTNAFCYPFFVYNNQAIENVKEAGFKLAFAGGDYKATKASNKYAIPRFHITRGITLEEFINIIE